MGIIKLPSIDSYQNKLPINTNFLPKIISKKIYTLLVSSLNIADDYNENMNDEKDKSQYYPRHKIVRLLN